MTLKAVSLAIAIASILGCVTPAQTSEELNQRMIHVVEKTSNTEIVVRQVSEGLNLLPSMIQQKFCDAGITITITPSLAQIGDGGKRSEYSPRLRSVVICEVNKDGTKLDLKRLPITTLHELGHALDQLLSYPSRKKQFQDLYSREAQNIPEQSRQTLSYFVSDPTTGPRECFASLFACSHYNRPDKRLDALKSYFPNSLQFVRGLEHQLEEQTL